jgi:drug/metabolite transporter (DMT)-like permease
MTTPTRAINLTAFLTLMLIAFMMGSNHIAARLAFNSGLDVATAVAARSLITASIVGLIVMFNHAAWRPNKKQARGILLVGLMIGVQGQCLYSAVARLPVALALLAFNTYPLWTALWDKLLYKRSPEKMVLYAMPVILFGLAMALDVLGAASGLGASAQWEKIGTGVLFGLAAGATFGLALVWTQYETEGLDGRVRTTSTLLIAGLIALCVIGVQDGPHWPQTTVGWGGFAALIFLYGTAFTIMFMILPKLGVAGNSAIMNVEPVFALIMGWAILDQAIAPIQMAGALVVVSTVIAIGLRKK